MLSVQVQHRIRIWRRGKSCGTCTTVIDWKGLRTAEASSSGWYPDAGTPIPTADRSSRFYAGISPNCWRTTWTGTTWTSRASPPSAPTEMPAEKTSGSSSIVSGNRYREETRALGMRWCQDEIFWRINLRKRNFFSRVQNVIEIILKYRILRGSKGFTYCSRPPKFVGILYEAYSMFRESTLQSRIVTRIIYCSGQWRNVNSDNRQSPKLGHKTFSQKMSERCLKDVLYSNFRLCVVWEIVRNSPTRM